MTKLLAILLSFWIAGFGVAGPAFLNNDTVHTYQQILSEDRSRNETEAALKLKEGLKEHKELIEISYETKEPKLDNLSDNIFKKAIQNTKSPIEGDYIYFHLQSYKGDWYGTKIGNTMYGVLRYKIEYDMTFAQEQAVTKTLKSLMPELIPAKATDYQKARAIFDFIRTTVSYDYVHTGSKTYRQRFTAYAALIQHCAVCQGYANLFYRMAKEAGLDCRVIYGKSQDQSHAWNIVKINNQWYNVDSTWASEAPLADKYFLKSNASFTDHIPNQKFLTKSFTAKYPISRYDFTYPISDNIKIQ